LNTKEDILKNVGIQTAGGGIDFHNRAQWLSSTQLFNYQHFSKYFNRRKKQIQVWLQH